MSNFKNVKRSIFTANEPTREIDKTKEFNRRLTLSGFNTMVVISLDSEKPEKNIELGTVLAVLANDYLATRYLNYIEAIREKEDRRLEDRSKDKNAYTFTFAGETYLLEDVLRSPEKRKELTYGVVGEIGKFCEKMNKGTVVDPYVWTFQSVCKLPNGQRKKTYTALDVNGPTKNDNPNHIVIDLDYIYRMKKLEDAEKEKEGKTI